MNLPRSFKKGVAAKLIYHLNDYENDGHEPDLWKDWFAGYK